MPKMSNHDRTPSYPSLSHRESHYSVQRFPMPPTNLHPSTPARHDERPRGRAQSLTRELESAGTWFREESVKSLRAFAEKSDEERRSTDSDSTRRKSHRNKDDFILARGTEPERISRYDFPHHAIANVDTGRRGASLDLHHDRSGRRTGASSRARSEPKGHERADGAAPPPPFSRHKSRTNLRDGSVPARSRAGSLTEVIAPTILQSDVGEHLESRLSTAHEEKASQVSESGSSLSSLYTASYLILFSILGTVARLGIQWLTFYAGSPSTFPVLWANFAGCLIMGFLSEDQTLFRNPSMLSILNPNAQDVAVAKIEHSKYRKNIPLFIGLATGFCGSLTSFSAFMRDIFLSASNDLPAPLYHPTTTNALSTFPRNNGYSIESILAVTIITISLSLSALALGAQLALFLSHFAVTPSLNRHTHILNPVVAVLGPALWLALLILCAVSSSHPVWRGQALISLVFAPVGCLTRWYISMRLNTLLPSFPMGTFAVNIFGTAVLGMSFDLQHVKLPGSGIVGCQVLQGVMDGFCGCLTTVSTWAVELRTLRRRHAWVYGATSVIVGFGVLIVIMGSMRWGVGWSAPVCVTAW